MKRPSSRVPGGVEGRGDPVILCSASPRRRQLIKLLRRPYVLHPVDVSESIREKSPSRLVVRLALRKALAGAKDFSSGIALGADTIVVLGGRVIGKPRDLAHAKTILRSLSGTTHRVYTGVALVDCRTGKRVTGYELSRTKMRALSEDELSRLAKKNMDKAGAYAVQARGDAVIEKIYGDYHNVVGFPVKKIKQLLRRFA